MKKVLFIQLKGNSFGGIWQVIKTIASSLINANYDVHIVSLRENKNNIKLVYDERIKLYTINKNDIWERNYSKKEIINDFKNLKIVNALKKITIKIKHKLSILKDTKKMHKYIYKYNPDYIITNHYQLLDMIPNKYLKNTIHEQHSSFKDANSNRANIKVFDKYKDKIKFIWLTKNTMKLALKKGYANSTYIYNPVRFKSDKKANVVKNKKLVTIARLSKDKSIDIMIDIVEDIFKDKKYQDWSLEIYGKGELEESLNKQINNKKQIKLMGLTDDPKNVLLNSSINLNTSKYEGFSLSILEANECGIPTIAFDFGESSKEQILENKTGIIAKSMIDYKKQLRDLMDNCNKLEEMSKNAKEFSKNFYVEKIIQDWLKILK